MKTSAFVRSAPLLLASVLLPRQAAAAAPSIMPVQMTLTDVSGDLVEGLHNFTFSLYATETFGSSLFDETIAIDVEGGNVLAYLGESKDLDLEIFRNDSDLWLQITIDGSEIIQPRFRLGTVPFAGYAQYCGQADGLSAIASQAFTYSAGTGLLLNSNAFSINTAQTQARVTGTCTSGQKITAISAIGTVTCSTDANTTYSAGSGITLSGTTFSIGTSAITSTHLASNSVGASELQNIALSCTEVQSGYTLLGSGASGINLDSGECPSGYSLTGGGYVTVGFAAVRAVSSNPGADGWHVTMMDSSTGGSRSVNVIGICCRLP